MVVVVCLNMLLDTYMSNSSAVVEGGVGLRRTCVAWEIKAYPHPTLPMDIGMAALGFFSAVFWYARGFSTPRKVQGM